MKRFHTIAVLAAALFIATAARAGASTIGITSQSGIINDGLLNWGDVGAEFADRPDPFTANVPGVSGLTVTLSQADSEVWFGRLDQHQASTGAGAWLGNFGPGEPLLWTGSSGEVYPLNLAFNDDIMGFGSQIQPNFYGAFTARIEAFDASDVSLGFFTADGESNNLADDSALFIGILSNTRDIRRISLGVVQASANLGDFAINSPNIQANPVPEPASLLLVGTGLVACVRRYRRRA